MGAMSRRSTGPARSRRSPVTDTSPCPCGPPGKDTYGACCGRFHRGVAAAPDAESLMRSRYSAFVVRDEPYLLRTWHPDSRPPAVGSDPATRWTGLEILETSGGSAFHTTATVTFRARFTRDGVPDTLHERSRFTRHEGAWVYVDGTYPD